MPGKFFVSAKGIIVQGKRALLLQAKVDDILFWDLPGGRLEIDEEFEAAFIRELKEEIIGIDKINIGDFLHIETTRRVVDEEPIVLLYFLVESVTDNLSLSEEHIGYRWIERTDVSKISREAKLFPSDKTALEQAFHKI